MKKKILSFVIALCFVVPVMFMLVGCGHTHTFDTENWKSNSTHHWHEATCEHKQETSAKAEHSAGTVQRVERNGRFYDITKCTVCEYELSTVEVHRYNNVFEVVDGKYCEVSRCQDCGAIESKKELGVAVATAEQLADVVYPAQASEETVKVYLTADIETEDMFYVLSKVELNLNGHNITLKTKQPSLFNVYENNELTINGEGTIDCASEINNFDEANDQNFIVSLWENGAKVTINSGTYNAGYVAVYVLQGEATINGGNFKCLKTESMDKYFLLNCLDANAGTTAKIVVKGGSFENFNPASNKADTNDNSTNYVAQGYEAYLDNSSSDPVKYVVEKVRVYNVESATDINEALNASKNAVGQVVIKLANDIDMDESIEVQSNIVLQLNGHNIYLTTKQTSLVNVKANGILTIEGNGTIDSLTKAPVLNVQTDYNYAVSVWDGGKVIINDGNFNAAYSAVYVKEGEVTINGGTFKCLMDQVNGTPKSFLLNCYDSNAGTTAIIVVKGGTFEDFNPAANASDSTDDTTNYVALGYRVTSETVDTKVIFTVSQ